MSSLPATVDPRDSIRSATAGEPAEFNSRQRPTLLALCQAHRWRIVLTYVLFNIENLLDLARPWLIGVTITALIDGHSTAVSLFAGFCVVRTMMGVLRRMYDTRTFLRMYCSLALGVVTDQKRQNVSTSRIAARTALSRELTDFLERDVPVTCSMLYSVIGGVVMLGTYDLALLPIAAILGAVGVGLNVLFSRRAMVLNRSLNDTYEREVDVISCASSELTRDHFGHVAQCQTRISDWQAAAYSATQAVALCLLLVALCRVPVWNVGTVGEVYAILRYVMMFTTGLGSLPMLSSRLARLRDIQRRFHVPETRSQRPVSHNDVRRGAD